METKTTSYYDFYNAFQPELLKNINELLVQEGTDPVNSLHGGFWHDGKWVDPGEGEYRNYWHAYLDCWGDGIRNDSYVSTYFADSDEDPDWEWYYEEVTKRRGEYAKVLVDAVRKMVKEHNLYGEVTIWFSW